MSKKRNDLGYLYGRMSQPKNRQKLKRREIDNLLSTVHARVCDSVDSSVIMLY